MTLLKLIELSLNYAGKSKAVLCCPQNVLFKKALLLPIPRLLGTGMRFPWCGARGTALTDPSTRTEPDERRREDAPGSPEGWMCPQHREQQPPPLTRSPGHIPQIYMGVTDGQTPRGAAPHSTAAPAAQRAAAGGPQGEPLPRGTLCGFGTGTSLAHPLLWQRIERGEGTVHTWRLGTFFIVFHLFVFATAKRE